MRYRYIVAGKDDESSIHDRKYKAIKEIDRVRALRKRPSEDYWILRHNITKDEYTDIGGGR